MGEGVLVSCHAAQSTVLERLEIIQALRWMGVCQSSPRDKLAFFQLDKEVYRNGADSDIDHPLVIFGGRNSRFLKKVGHTGHFPAAFNGEGGKRRFAWC